MPLFATRIDIHIVNVRCIFCKAFMCRRAVEEPNPNFIWVQVFKYIDGMLHLIHKLLEVPPGIMIFSWIDDFV